MLVFGKQPVDEQLEPYWELDLPMSELRDDKRAVFELVVPSSDLEQKFKEFQESNSEYRYDTPIEFMRKYHGYYYSKEHDGYGYYHNPNAKWDWYSIGGRWSGYLINKNGEPEDYTTVDNVDWDKMKEDTFPPYGFILDGKWYAKGEMGWFGMSDDKCEKDVWDEYFWKKVKEIPGEYPVTVVDCHI
jgi:hypothetical protein